MTCFPGISDQELNKIRKDSYLNLASVLLESLKGLFLTETELYKRNRFIGAELVDEYLKNKRSVICVCPHYANWEWSVLGVGYRFPNKSIGIYKKINNPYIETYIKKLRGRCSMKLRTTHETRFIIEDIPLGRVLLFMSDQNPSNIKDAIWVKFFGRDTACLHGLEKYARAYQLPVIYMDMCRTSPAHYTLNFTMLCENPMDLEFGELTQKFMNQVEQTIRQNPADWLWSHKRWKHQKDTVTP